MRSRRHQSIDISSVGGEFIVRPPDVVGRAGFTREIPTHVARFVTVLLPTRGPFLRRADVNSRQWTYLEWSG